MIMSGGGHSSWNRRSRLHNNGTVFSLRPGRDWAHDAGWKGTCSKDSEHCGENCLKEVVSSIQNVRHESNDRSENSVGDSTFFSLSGQHQDAVDSFIDRRWNSNFIPPDKSQNFGELVRKVQQEKSGQVSNDAGQINYVGYNGPGQVSCKYCTSTI